MVAQATWLQLVLGLISFSSCVINSRLIASSATTSGLGDLFGRIIETFCSEGPEFLETVPFSGNGC